MYQDKPSDPSIDQVVTSCIKTLTDTCQFHEYENFKRVYTEEDIAKMKQEHFELSAQLEARTKLAAAVKEASTGYSNPKESIAAIIDGMKPAEHYGFDSVKNLKARTTELIECIERGFEMVRKQVFAFPYYQAGYMAFYDRDGMFAYDRPLKDKEMQASIHSIKTA